MTAAVAPFRHTPALEREVAPMPIIVELEDGTIRAVFADTTADLLFVDHDTGEVFQVEIEDLATLPLETRRLIQSAQEEVT